MSLDYWQKLSLEVLKLVCNPIYLIDSGSRIVLARRLYDFYHPQLESFSAPSLAVANAFVPASIDVPLSVQPPDFSTVDIAAIVHEEVQRVLRNPYHNSVTSPPPPPLVFPPAHSTSTSELPFIQPAAPSTSALPFIKPAAQPRNRSSKAMPPLPQSVINNIRNGEFVNFDNLLPNRAPATSDEYTFKVMGGSTQSVELVPKHQRKTKVTDFNSWMVAWNNFLRCFSYFFPHRLLELVRY